MITIQWCNFHRYTLFALTPVPCSIINQCWLSGGICADSESALRGSWTFWSPLRLPFPLQGVTILRHLLEYFELHIYNSLRIQDVTYTSCTTVDRGQPWCATDTDPSGNFLPGRYSLNSCHLNRDQGDLNHLLTSWGYCPLTCPSTCTPGSKWSSNTCTSCTCNSDGKAVCSEQKSCSPPLPPSSSPSTRCLTESGPSKGIPCVLPFSFQVTKVPLFPTTWMWSKKFKGRSHTTCAPWTFGGEHEGKLWCSTKWDDFFQINTLMCFFYISLQNVSFLSP